jgi:hypothetical protein
MQRLKLMGLALIAAFALTAFAAAAAQAADPPILVCSFKSEGNFKDPDCKEAGAGSWEKLIILPGQRIPFRVLSGPGILGSATGETLTCQKDLGTGEIIAPDSVGGVSVTFSECTGKKNETEKACTVKSTNGGPGEIKTATTLKGLYGLVAHTESTSGVGLLLEPETGKVFVNIASATCAIEAAVEGSLAGEVPLQPISLLGRLLFIGTAGTQKIKKITVLSGEKKPELSAFGLVKASEQTNEVIHFSVAIEIP